ncbi:MAG: InlB B-repeat-containing protein [Clostridia bacterium]|nr:InlB B-repeat-containing protein [Clostridia bacterium]
MKKISKVLALMLVFAMLLPMAIACADETVTVSFDSGGGSEVAAVTLNKGEKLAKPTDPQKDGYTFDGWYNGEEKWSFSSYYVNEDITLTAKWQETLENKATVTFDCNGGGFENGDTTSTLSITGRQKIDKPADPTRDGYTFDGWYNGEEKWSFSAYYAEEDMTLTARWIIDNPPEIKHTVSFDSGGAGEYPDQTVDHGSFATEPDAPSKDGMLFIGWFNGDTKWNFSTGEVTEDLNLVARYRSASEILTVSFDSDGAQSFESQLLSMGDKVKDPGAPERSGWVFSGWYHDGLLWDFTSAVEDDVHLVAKWAEKGEAEIIASGSCSADGSAGSAFTWFIDEELTLTVNGSGALTMTRETAPWHNEWSGKIRKLVFGEGITSIAPSSGYIYLIERYYALEEIVYPSTVRTLSPIGYCHALKSIVIPEGVTSIANAQVAQQCFALEYIYIPSTITGSLNMFGACPNLKTVVVMSTTASLTSHLAACLQPMSQSERARYYVPAGSKMINAFASAAEKGYEFEYSLITDSAPINDDTSWLYTQDKRLLIIGDGKMMDYTAEAYFTPRWYEYGYVNEIEYIEVCQGVTHVGSYAFNNMIKLKSARVADSVASIGKGAFIGAEIADNIDIGNGTVYIAKDAFDDCSEDMELYVAIASFGKAWAEAFGYESKIMSGNVLAIGNSLTNDSVGSGVAVDDGYWLKAITEELAPDNRIVFVEMTYGGRTLNTHYETSLTDSTDTNAFVYISGVEKTFGFNQMTNVQKYLTFDWDIIVLQDYNEAFDSGKHEQLASDMQKFVRLFRDLDIDAPIVWFNHWLAPYDAQSRLSNMRTFYSDFLPTLYELDEDGEEIVGDKVIDTVISGSSMLENLKTSYLGSMSQNNGKNGNVLYRQNDVHLNYEVARFASALLWVKTLFGYDISKTEILADNSTQPGSVSHDMLAMAIEAATNAYLYPMTTVETTHKNDPVLVFAEAIEAASLSIDLISSLSEAKAKEAILSAISKYIEDYVKTTGAVDIVAPTLDAISLDFEQKKATFTVSAGYTEKQISVSYTAGGGVGSLITYGGHSIGNDNGAAVLLGIYGVSTDALSALAEAGYNVEIGTLYAKLSELVAGGDTLTYDLSYAVKNTVLGESVNKVTDGKFTSSLAYSAVSSADEAYVFAAYALITDEDGDVVGTIYVYSDEPADNEDGSLTDTVGGETLSARSFYYVASRQRDNGFAGLDSETVKLAMDIIYTVEAPEGDSGVKD